MRSTVSHIAKEAGVSPATVDRVLNGREGVRARTRDIVMEVATRLGYFGPVASTTRQEIRMEFLLPAGNNTFMLMLRKFLFEEATAYGGINASLHLIEAFDPETLSQKLRELEGKTDAVALVALDHPIVREAINHLASTGIRVATLVSDISSVNKIGYVGIDNRAAGRPAGLLMGRFLGDGHEHATAIFIGSSAYRGHEEREMGYRSILAQDFPLLKIADIIPVSEDRDRAYDAARRLLDSKSVKGIYNIGSGNQGIGRALREAQQGRDVVFIGHDLTDATRMMLLDRTMDAVIDQNPRVEAREAVKLLVSAVRGSKEPEYLPRLQVIFRENIPTY
jgi:LacI family transcriptional regulator